MSSLYFLKSQGPPSPSQTEGFVARYGGATKSLHCDVQTWRQFLKNDATKAHEKLAEESDRLKKGKMTSYLTRVDETKNYGKIAVELKPL